MSADGESCGRPIEYAGRCGMSMDLLLMASLCRVILLVYSGHQSPSHKSELWKSNCHCSTLLSALHVWPGTDLSLLQARQGVRGRIKDLVGTNTFLF